MMKEQKTLLTPAEAAKRLGLTRRTLARLDIASIRPNPTGHRRYPVAEIERLLKGRPPRREM